MGRRSVLSYFLLTALGAPLVGAQTTINVEVDWLKHASHDHKPTTCEMDAVVTAFARNGITLNIEMSTEITETAALQQIDFVTPSVFENGEWAALEATNRDHAAGTGWHYAVFGHNYTYNGSFTSSSGLAEINGDEFLVSLGSFSSSIGTPFDRSGTFMHELGHNLGLRHAGDQDEGIVRQYKPNYPSVMAYRHQLAGVRAAYECQDLVTGSSPFYHLDYSHGNCTLDLDENALDESVGIGFGAVDWDCSGGIGGVASQDVSSGNDWCSLSGDKSLLTDYDDWSNVTSVARVPDSSHEVTTCMTAEEHQEIQAALGGCGQPDPCAVDTGSDCVGPAPVPALGRPWLAAFAGLLLVGGVWLLLRRRHAWGTGGGDAPLG